MVVNINNIEWCSDINLYSNVYPLSICLMVNDNDVDEKHLHEWISGYLEYSYGCCPDSFDYEVIGE